MRIQRFRPTASCLPRKSILQSASGSAIRTQRTSCHPSFFFNATATTETYTLSLHDALPISPRFRTRWAGVPGYRTARTRGAGHRSEEHTSELQSRSDLVCRLLLEKKKYRALALLIPIHVGEEGDDRAEEEDARQLDECAQLP